MIAVVVWKLLFLIVFLLRVKVILFFFNQGFAKGSHGRKPSPWFMGPPKRNSSEGKDDKNDGRPHNGFNRGARSDNKNWNQGKSQSRQPLNRPRGNSGNNQTQLRPNAGSLGQNWRKPDNTRRKSDDAEKLLDNKQGGQKNESKENSTEAETQNGSDTKEEKQSSTKKQVVEEKSEAKPEGTSQDKTESKATNGEAE